MVDSTTGCQQNRSLFGNRVHVGTVTVCLDFCKLWHTSRGLTITYRVPTKLIPGRGRDLFFFELLRENAPERENVNWSRSLIKGPGEAVW